MARIRSVKPEFWHSADVCSVCRDARLLWIGLWNYADDAGRGDARLRQIKIQVFPGDADITEEVLATLLLELHNAELGLELYEVEGKPYYHVPPEAWDNKLGGHQRIDKPQKPKFPEPSGTFPGTFQEYSRNSKTRKPPRKRAQPTESKGANPDSANTPGTLQERSRRIGKERRGKERKGEEGAAPPTESKSPEIAEEAPPWLQVIRLWRDIGEEIAGEPVFLDPESHRKLTEKLYALCLQVDNAAPLEVARDTILRYWRAKHANGKPPKLRFLVEDFQEYRAGAKTPVPVTRDEIEAKIVRAEARRREAQTELESATVFRDTDKIAEATAKVNGWSNKLTELRRQL